MSEKNCEICGTDRHVSYYDVADDVFDDVESKMLCAFCFSENYSYCEECNRDIANLASNNIRNNFMEQTCISCVQDDWLKNGMEKSLFSANMMYADFFDAKDLKDHDFKLVEAYMAGEMRYGNVGLSDIRKCQNKALELIAAGRKVIINIVDASITGGGGNFELYATD